MPGERDTSVFFLPLRQTPAIANTGKPALTIFNSTARSSEREF